MKQSKPEINTNKTSSQPKQGSAKSLKPSTSAKPKSGTSTNLTGKPSGGIGGSPIRGNTTASNYPQSGSIGTGTKGNSISFGAVNFDAQKNILKVRTTQGNSQILCCITGDALRECFHAGTSAQDLEKTFHQHEREIQYCAQQKIQNKQWKIPNQEILLNTQDLRQYTK